MIRLLLYNLGLKKLDTLNNKLDFIKLSKINPYDPLYLDMQILHLGVNIIEYTKVLELITKKMDVINIQIDYTFDLTLSNSSLGIWCSDGRLPIEDIEIVIDKFLTLCMEVNNLYLTLTANSNKFIGRNFYNAKKLHPHIINIENIISTIVNRKIKE